ncbi:hypothetical protein BGY98DRAFT_1104665 [Russula aff. rugulosa BPL654]|nr:hypothetical protein BGY98DRAFT_1104665 [Russula aff. rugulosa BPL654]
MGITFRVTGLLLCTGSQTSLSTTTSLADSVTVNAAVTWSTSPTALSTSRPTRLTAPSTAMLSLRQVLQAQANAVEQLTKAKGFKNTTTLDAITARYARTCSLSVDCTAMPPEAEPIEDTQTPGLITKPPEHPLQNSWTICHDTKTKVPSSYPAAPTKRA